jgi:hypothetical protein
MSQKVLVFALLLIAACAQKPGESSTDSVATASIQQPKVTKVLFKNPDLFNVRLPFETRDPQEWEKWFPGDDGDCDTFEYDNGAPWYSLCSYTGPELLTTFYDFPEKEDEANGRYYFYEIKATGPSAVFSNGIHVGMTKSEFIAAAGVTDPAAAESKVLEASNESGLFTATYDFDNDSLQTITFHFTHSNYPFMVDDIANVWTEVYYGTGEDPADVEMHVPCPAATFTLQEIDDDKYGNYLVVFGGSMDAETDTVRWIKRTEAGIEMSMKDSETEEVYSIELGINGDEWTLVTWNDKTMASGAFKGPLIQDECDEGQAAEEGEGENP